MSATDKAKNKAQELAVRPKKQSAGPPVIGPLKSGARTTRRSPSRAPARRSRTPSRSRQPRCLTAEALTETSNGYAVEMTVIGFHCSHEQINPAQLLRDVQRAEQAGFTAGMSSDHFSPWSARQGESGFAWSFLGAALA